MLYAAFVDSHRDQLQSIPKNLWKPIHRKLCWDNEPTELELLVSDPDCHKVTLRLPVSLLTDTQSATTDIGDLDPDGQVFVLDHMFTFPEDKLYESLEATDRPEVDLVANILKRRGMDTSTTDALANAIWVVADAYAMTVTDGSGKSAQHHMWYIPGEKILNMQHSDTPNMECRIFFDMYGMRPVSMLWPTRVIKPGETLTRDYLWSSKDKKERQALAFAWFQKNEPLLQQIAPNLIRDSAQSILDQPSVDQLKARSSLATPTDCNMQTRVNGLSIGEDSSDADLERHTESGYHHQQKFAPNIEATCNRPKLVAKYIHPPALLEGKIKFDLRVLVIVESVSPLRMYFVPSAIYARESHIAYDAT
ncbi:hypothetical protein BASA81_009572 [Batrachochytrium salamandrivorans]|nr:hypothetical protein BASA81_009572 [Batrachochytrium salamandrivorans]